MPDPSAWFDDGTAPLRRASQGVIDAEMRATRRQVLTTFRRRLRTDTSTLIAPDFLRLADPPTVHTAILIAASGVTASCAVHTYHPERKSFRLAECRGVPRPFQRDFRPPDGSDPILVDDVRADPSLLGDDTVGVLLAADFRAVQCYPLHDDDAALLAVLTLLHHAPGARSAQSDLAGHAAAALSHLAGDPATSDALITTDTAGGTTTLSVRGSLDAVSAPALIEALLASDLTASRQVVIDLREVEFLAVAGARALLDVEQECRARGLDCRLISDPDQDARTILTRLGRPPDTSQASDSRIRVDRFPG